MSIRACDTTDAHLGHRFGPDEFYCVGRHAVADGSWRSHKLSGGRTGKAHFFLAGESRSICGYGHKSRSKLARHIATRRVCNHCGHAVPRTEPSTQHQTGNLTLEKGQRFDPEPYVGWSGARYSYSASAVASLDDGPVLFEPRPEYAKFIAYGTAPGDTSTHLYLLRDGGTTTAFCGVNLSEIEAGFTTEPSYRYDITCDACIEAHDESSA